MPKKNASTLTLPWLSPRACAWLVSVGARRTKPPLAADAITQRLGARADWACLRQLEERYGGILGDEVQGRELWLGMQHAAFGRERAIDGRPHVLCAAFVPIVWYADEAGRIVEIDDLGERFYESDSIAHRIEQLAIFGIGTAHRIDGRRGEEIAALLALSPIPEASDTMQLYWGSGGSSFVPQDGPLVCENLTPSDYGKNDRVWSTWVSAKTARGLAAAKKKLALLR